MTNDKYRILDFLAGGDGVDASNAVSVAESGGDFASIQAAIDSITDASADKRYSVLVYPGTYEENIVGKNYVNIYGVGGRKATKIKGTSGTLFTLPDTEMNMEMIALEMNPTSDSDLLLDATTGGGVTGSYRLDNVDIILSTDVPGIKPLAIEANAGIGLFCRNVDVRYTLTSNTATGIISAISILPDNGAMYFLRSIVIGTIDTGAGANFAVVSDTSLGTIIFSITTATATTTNSAFSGISTPYAVYGADGFKKQISDSALNALGTGGTAGTGYALYFDTTTNDGVVRMKGNNYTVSGYLNNRRYYVGNGDTLRSVYNQDYTDTVDQIQGAGILQQIDSRLDASDFVVQADTDITGDVVVTGDVDYSGVLVGSHDDITATSEGVAASVETETTFVTTNGDSDLDDVTLADGVEGQIKNICCVAEGNSADTWKVTPANMVGGSQITFAGVGEGCILKMHSSGWVVIGNNGGTIS